MMPTTLRRHYGTVTCHEINPDTQPQLSKHQAAVAGGSCGRNIDLVVKHLGQNNAMPTRVVRTPQWDAVFGPAAGPVLQLCCEGPGHDLGPAALLEDQEQAYERMDHSYLDAVYHG